MPIMHKMSRRVTQLLVLFASLHVVLLLGLERAFSYSGPAAWNRLPHDICASPSMNVFKWKSKTHLFIEAFYGRPMEQGRPLYFCPVVSSIFFFFSLPNLSRRRLHVCHTSTHGVALVRI